MACDDFMSYPTVLLVIPLVFFTSPWHHHLLKIHHLSSQRNFCVSIIFFPCLFSLLPTASLCSPPGRHHPFFKPQLQHLPLPRGPRAQKELLKELGESPSNSGSYFDITSKVLPGLPGTSGKQERQHRFKLGCTLGFHLGLFLKDGLCSTQRRKV